MQLIEEVVPPPAETVWGAQTWTYLLTCTGTVFVNGFDGHVKRLSAHLVLLK